MKIVSIALVTAFVVSEFTLAHGRLFGKGGGLRNFFSGRGRNTNNENELLGQTDCTREGTCDGNQNRVGGQGDCARDGTCDGNQNRVGGQGGGGDCVRSGDGTCLGLGVAGPDVVPLTDVERDELLFMRQEEKMARDVYRYHYRCWGELYPTAIVFDRIADSEQQHMGRMGELITYYSLVDPVTSNDEGNFTDTTLTKMYEDLTKNCNEYESLMEAFEVGAFIEETDIFDLRLAKNATVQAPLERAYGSLLKASYNHYNAFVRQIKAQGGTYVPRVISAGDSEAILGNTP
uniref:DUF2202 domain-containing protein n=1 Tax=Amphora coffeiformis TaxID=265554 RepID=A0A7S3KY53_9STRA|mmetsp:Transcript_2359/g.4703  ORF Transcript_2359/g.4703 Transcript_2359/m.4703 type:complete len:290 (+) Transcript_2359:107-976(+)|eukprot:scaffold1602_cov151-Amphora_coffeaeformis.AAC.2